MAYLLKGRALPIRFNEETLGRCIFCGRQLRHFNGCAGKNNGWLINAWYKGHARSFYYCKDICPQRDADETYEMSIWRCGCVSDYIENVGDRCVSCDKIREKADPVPGSPSAKVFAAHAWLIFKDDPSDRKLSRLVDELDGVAGSDVRLVLLSSSARQYPARVFDMQEEWSDDEEGEEGEEGKGP